MHPTFPATRAAGLEALRDFLPKAGAAYTSNRNYDLPGHPHVSRLSPYIRHRMVTEEEVLAAVLGRFSPKTAEKFVQEVFWRTYWKGWLEMRPSVWIEYKAGLGHARDRLATEGGLRKGWEAACAGATGIDAFDHWAAELTETGYMHNHARMWFASIWIFTLGLPWQLGADFFLRHLLDGDPASNTLGWRWVAGLQTPGKVYTARSSNITKYTEGRFGGIHGLASDPAPVDGPPNPPRGALPESSRPDPALRTGLLLTEDDLSPGWLLDASPSIAGTAVLAGATERSPFHVAPMVLDFTQHAIEDSLARYGDRLGAIGPVLGTSAGETPDAMAEAVLGWAQAANLQQVVAAHPPTGPAGDLLTRVRPKLDAAGIRLATPIRAYDLAAWPHATHGFFRFKEKIPSLIGGVTGLRAA